MCLLALRIQEDTVTVALSRGNKDCQHIGSLGRRATTAVCKCRTRQCHRDTRSAVLCYILTWAMVPAQVDSRSFLDSTHFFGMYSRTDTMLDRCMSSPNRHCRLGIHSEANKCFHLNNSLHTYLRGRRWRRTSTTHRASIASVRSRTLGVSRATTT